MNNKNILITLTNSLDPESGGPPRVYWNLAPELIKQGYNVYVTYNYKSKCDDNNVFTDVFYLGDKQRYTKEYIKQFEHLIKRWNIDIVICMIQWDYVNYFSHRKDLKVFYHVHSTPFSHFCHTPSFFPRKLLGSKLERLAKKIDVRYRYFHSFHRIEKNGQKMVLLSNGYRKELKSIFPFKDRTIISIPNPIVIKEDKVELCNSRKSILYVGRPQELFKRFHSVLNIWGKIHGVLKDYQLDVVGDSTFLKEEKALSKRMGLKNITFHGSQIPDEYYKKASLLIMTSEVEGFPMVLGEAMSYGCIPFAFDTFAALHDIIDDGVNGFIIPPFDEDKYAQSIIDFTNLPDAQKSMMRTNAYNKAKSFSVDLICKRWIKDFEKTGTKSYI